MNKTMSRLLEMSLRESSGTNIPPEFVGCVGLDKYMIIQTIHIKTYQTDTILRLIIMFIII